MGVMTQGKQVSEMTARKRKMMLMLPLVVVPMLVMGFYWLGGGKGGAAVAGEQKGINMSLPVAQLATKGKPTDKMGFYDKAAQDSARWREKMKQDPYAAGRVDSVATRGGVGQGATPGAVDGLGARRLSGAMSLRPVTARSTGVTGLQTGVMAGRVGAETQADEVLRRVEQLKKALGRTGAEVGEHSPADFGGRPGTGLAAGSGLMPGTGLAPAMGPGAGVLPGDAVGGSRDRDKLKELMAGLGARAGLRADPEMDRIDAMLSKILRIQHPEEVVRDTGAVVSGAGAIWVGAPRGETAVRTMEGWGDGGAATGGDGTGTEAGFMEIGEEDSSGAAGAGRLAGTAPETAIEAVVNGDQTLTAGSTVALRLVSDVTIGGLRIPANQLLYGMASLSGERLAVHVASIRIGESIVPVALQVYDLDGLAGIRVPGAISRDVSKESADEALSGLGVASVDPSLGAQAASAGLQFAKSLASRKVRLVRVTLPAGYRVLLKNTKSITH